MKKKSFFALWKKGKIPKMPVDHIDRGANLIRLIVENGGDKEGRIANELLSEFHGDYPLENLRHLLNSGSNEVVGVGVWIASELGAKARPLLSEIAPLINVDDRKVRFFSIDCIQSTARPKDRKIVLDVAKLCADEDDAIRWKVLFFLSQIGEEIIVSVSDYAVEKESDKRHIDGLIMLKRVNNIQDEEILMKIRSSDKVVRSYAAAAAARLYHASPDILENSLFSSDEVVRNFSDDFIKRIGIGRRP